MDIEAFIQLIRYRITIYFIQLYSHKKYLAYSLLFLCIMYRHSNLNKMNTTQWHERIIQIPHATPTIQNKLYYMSFHYILHAVCHRFILTIVSIWKESSFLIVIYFRNVLTYTFIGMVRNKLMYYEMSICSIFYAIHSIVYKIIRLVTTALLIYAK